MASKTERDDAAGRSRVGRAAGRARGQSASSPCDRCGRRHLTRTGAPACIAHSKRRDDRGKLVACRRPPEPGRQTCRFHGGTQPVGPASPHWKHGMHSRFLPTRYLASFEAALDDPELISVRNQIALLDAREMELIQQLSAGEAGYNWRAAKAALRRLGKAKARSGHPAFKTLAKLIDNGAADERRWTELRENAESRRRLANTERQRLEWMGAYLTVEELAIAAAFLAGIMKRYIPDTELLRKAADELGRFFSLWRPGTPAPTLARGDYSGGL
jgi:hypothetical protein